MSLLGKFISVLQLWRPAFSSKRSFQSARDYACAIIGGFGLKKTLTNLSISTGQLDKKPSAIYKFFSKLKWSSEDLFNPILKQCLPFFKKGYIAIGVDDSKFKKTGRHIPMTGWHRDPMSPKFHTNLVWGLRFLQFSVLVPLYDFVSSSPCRAVPIRFIDAPPVKKPGKKASAKEKENYVQAKMTHSLSTIFVTNAKKLRGCLDSIGAACLRILFVCDGSFCNAICMNMSIAGAYVLARCRKNVVLCFSASEGRRKYSDKKFTPETVRQDDNVPYRKGLFFYGGERREVRYKELLDVLWQRVTKMLRLRLIVIAPIPYTKGLKKNYREPGYLLTTDLITPVEELIQVYLDRLQIEYNFRDEKSIIGVGEAQVRNEKSVSREPAFSVAVYSALLMSSILEYGDCYNKARSTLPDWRQAPSRPSCKMLMKELFEELRNSPEKVIKLDLTVDMICGIMRKVA